ncbi:uncharacterized protein N7477_009486 [Penicillium maclennaniae]|uniref:uncharacterized protein n=1 Tax=Penicillium maclennaniae TaxID=1343394 RepID=UPI00254041FA|nr:uncharacterized protein N7477_009486 [Penicillium maclennaniae]KAJ5661870.1 hypothetical protein N7477_009486 [Penicillium maclennaniae]
MASIQEQIKHIRFSNDEWYGEHQKLIGELAQLSRRATPDTRSLSSTPRPELASGPESDSSRSQQEVSSAR